MSTPSHTRILRCCHCSGMMRVTARALSVFCPHCQTRVTLEDLRIVGSHPGKRLATSGNIVVESTARLQLELVGSRVLIHGRVKGSVQASEYVEIGPTGQVVGDIKAPKLVVRDGGLMHGRFERLVQRTSDSVALKSNDPAAGSDAAADTSDAVNRPSSDLEPPAPQLRPLPLPPPATN